VRLRVLSLLAVVVTVTSVTLFLRPGHWITAKVFNESRQPGIFVDPPVVDFGEVDGGEFYHELRIHNRTADSLHISGIRSSCPCLTLELNSKSVAPGQSVNGRLRLDTTHEAGFGGNLLVTIEVLGADERTAVTLRTQVCIKPRTKSKQIE
jgi:hypothetical protein